MDGQLAELEARWREAEETAAIAGSLLIDPAIDEKSITLRLDRALTRARR